MNDADNSRSRPKRLGLVVAALAVIGFLGYTGFNLFRVGKQKVATQQAPAVHPVRVATAQIMALNDRLELTGEVRPWQEVLVFSKVPGQVIRQLTVQKGDRVKVGQVLARLDEDTIRARLEEGRAALAAAKAGIAQVEANLSVLEKDRQRFEALYREKAVARRQLDQIAAQQEAAAAGLAVARAQAARAEAVLRQLELTREDHCITAPMDGVVTARYFDPGNLSSTDRPLLQLADTSRAKVITFVSEEDLPRIHTSIAAQVRLDAHPQKTFDGTVSVINTAVSPATRTADIEIHLDNPKGLLQPGMYARLTLLMGQIKAVVIDGDAVVRMPGTGSEYVFTVEKGCAVQVNVVTGLREDRFVQVRQGVNSGTMVVVEGQGELRQGDRVSIMPSEGSAENGGRAG
jgi:membrane fusion protein (multidrug efflux system)